MTPVLVTIPISHYCEKARWALERAGIAYAEEAHPPLFHMAATRRGGGRSTPQLRLADRTLLDSRDIVRWADTVGETGLVPEDVDVREAVLAFERRCDDDLGPAVRRYAYFYLLDRLDLLVPAFTWGVGPVERGVFGVVRPLVPALMRKGMNIDATTAERSRQKLLAVFDDADAMLADGRRFLGGDRFSAADLAFAALGAPMVLPPEHPVTMPSIEAMPVELARDVAALRARPSGRLILRLYAEERRAIRPPA